MTDKKQVSVDIWDIEEGKPTDRLLLEEGESLDLGKKRIIVRGIYD